MKCDFCENVFNPEDGGNIEGHKNCCKNCYDGANIRMCDWCKGPEHVTLTVRRKGIGELCASCQIIFNAPGYIG